MISATLENAQEIRILTIVGDTMNLFDNKISAGIRRVFQINLSGP